MDSVTRDPLFRDIDEPEDADDSDKVSVLISSRATIYALLLREHGYSSEEMARLVVRRYPQVRKKLKQFLKG